MSQKMFTIEYELPPMRAIYTVDMLAASEADAREGFTRLEDASLYRIRKVYEKGESVTNCTDNHGYLSDIHGNTGKAGFHKAPLGDQGQRYMVVADFNGVEKPVGYTNNPTGGSLMEGAKKWPACTNPRIIDRNPNQPK